MATWDALAACARRWYVVLVGLVLTGTAASAVAAVDGVTSAHVEVVFLAPATPQTPNKLASAATSVVATAGLVERLVNGGAQPPATSDMVTLLGRGVRDGTSVVLPDSGGQWAQNFDRPVLVVEVTGPSADDVAARLSAAVGEVEWTLERIQVEEGVRPRDRITTSLVPAEPRVRVEQGHRGAALGMTLLLGLLLTAVSAVSVDRLARTRPWRH